MTSQPPPPSIESSTPDEHRFCIIVGAGISGIIHAAEILRKKILPYEEFEILDRSDGFGGVWWNNTYPGAACDIMSHIYQLSWCRNPGGLNIREFLDVYYIDGTEFPRLVATVCKPERDTAVLGWYCER
jgi:hypothetical protein